MTMSSHHFFAAPCAVVLAFLALSCEGPAGPPGGGFGSLDDPSVMPAVVYTYPPMNSSGPYPDFYLSECSYGPCSYYSMIQIRFNKFMDVTSVRRAVRIASSEGRITTDTGRIISYGGDVVMVNPVDTTGSMYNARFAIGEAYTLTVDSTAVDVNGNPLRPPFSMTFTPEPWFRVIDLTPADGATGVGTMNSIGFQFNSGVDSSILPHIRISPEVEYSTYVYKGMTQLYLSPREALENSTVYTVSVDSGAPDAEGNPLHGSATASFTTVGFGITTIYPYDGYTQVSLNADVTVGFTSRFDTASFRRAFTVTPGVPGSLSFDLYNLYARFRPAVEWDELTAYTVKVDTQVTSAAGERLAAPSESRFTTARFRVSINGPSYGSGGTTRYPYIGVYPNTACDTTTIAGALSLEPPVPLTVRVNYGVQSFVAVPAELLAPSTRYVFRVDTTLRTRGGIRLSAPDSVVFTTGSLK